MPSAAGKAGTGAQKATTAAAAKQSPVSKAAVSPNSAGPDQADTVPRVNVSRRRRVRTKDLKLKSAPDGAVKTEAKVKAETKSETAATPKAKIKVKPKAKAKPKAKTVAGANARPQQIKKAAPQSSKKVAEETATPVAAPADEYFDDDSGDEATTSNSNAKAKEAGPSSNTNTSAPPEKSEVSTKTTPSFDEIDDYDGEEPVPRRDTETATLIKRAKDHAAATGVMDGLDDTEAALIRELTTEADSSAAEANTSRPQQQQQQQQQQQEQQKEPQPSETVPVVKKIKPQLVKGKAAPSFTRKGRQRSDAPAKMKMEAKVAAREAAMARAKVMEAKVAARQEADDAATAKLLEAKVQARTATMTAVEKAKAAEL